MAMKPAGKAILIGLVTIAGAFGVYQSGILKPKQPPVVEAPVHQNIPEPAPAVSAKEAADEAARAATAARPTPPQPINTPLQQSDAFDQLIRQSGKK